MIRLERTWLSSTKKKDLELKPQANEKMLKPNEQEVGLHELHRITHVRKGTREFVDQSRLR